MIPDRDRPTAANFTDKQLQVTLANGSIIPVALENYPILAQATPDQQTNFQLSLSGIYWPDIKLEISLLALLGETASLPRPRKPRYCEG